MNRKMMVAIDLFAGCGGLSLGLRLAGWDIACAVERSPMAAETYFANFINGQTEDRTCYASHLARTVTEQIKAGLLVGDVQTFTSNIGTVREMMGDHEVALLAGGPPCQGFSVAGKRDARDPRNELVWRFLEACELLNPQLVLMENVGAIQSPFRKGRRGSVLPELERALQLTKSPHGGYSTIRLTLRADQYGVPQFRKRMFLIGVRKDLADRMGIPAHQSWDSENDTEPCNRPLVAPATRMQRPPTAKEAIWDLIAEEYAPLESAPSGTAQEYAYQARSELNPCFGTPIGITNEIPPNHIFRSHKVTTATRFRLLRLFQEHGIRENIFELATRGGANIEEYIQPLQARLPIDLPFQRVATLDQLSSLVRLLGSRKQSQRPLTGNAPSPTITTLPDDLCHYQVDRVLTVREMARLQSFPDHFIFKGKETTGGDKRREEVPQYSQVGNAVPPLLSEALGRQLRMVLEGVEFLAVECTA